MLRFYLKGIYINGLSLKIELASFFMNERMVIGIFGKFSLNVFIYRLIRLKYSLL